MPLTRVPRACRQRQLMHLLMLSTNHIPPTYCGRRWLVRTGRAAWRGRLRGRISWRSGEGQSLDDQLGPPDGVPRPPGVAVGARGVELGGGLPDPDPDPILGKVQEGPGGAGG